MNSPGILNIVWHSVDLIEQNHVQLLTSEQTRTMIIHTSVVVLILNDFRKFNPIGTISWTDIGCAWTPLSILKKLARWHPKQKSYLTVLFRYVSESETGALRKCCVDKTYDPRVLACCQDGILKQHGTCGIWILSFYKDNFQRVIFYIFHPWSKFESWKWVCNSLFILLETKYTLYYSIRVNTSYQN